MSDLPNCPACASEFTYDDGIQYVCPECGNEWSKSVESSDAEAGSGIRDANGNMLADVSGEEVEAYLLANSLVVSTDREAGAPTNQPCENEMSESEISFR